jgi:hypothetical protein
VKVLRVEKKRYINDDKIDGSWENDYGNGVLTRKTFTKAVTLDPDGKEHEMDYEDISLRIRCLDCGRTLEVYSSTLAIDYVEIGGVLAPKKLWREILKDVLEEVK